ncbi:MAG TPA: helix-turn-helix transcriptional regulator [Candidatus Limnocylindrales bacterium]|nr:helix-turn-helix transcriptional regulator [Candidatus Limnocylindrales bacterium]
MGETRLRRAIRERQTAARHAVGRELRAARLDSGVSIRALGKAIGVDPSHLARAEAGTHALSHDALVAVATGLGRDVSLRLFEASAPLVRDRISSMMHEALLGNLDRRWMPLLEVAVHRPVRGVIDLVLRDETYGDLVAGEGHSRLHTVEGQLRHAAGKADSLPSARGWPWSDAIEAPPASRLLVLRSCAAMHDLVRALPTTFATAYPGDTERAVAALTGGAERWPGSSIVWVRVDGARTRVLPGVPPALRR